MELPPIVSEEEWQRSHEQLLAKEKEATKAADALAAERRRAPMKEVSTDFRFEGPEGEVGFLDLFDGRSQLILYHFWFPEGGKPCVGCSMVGDQLTHVAHVNARDTTIAFVSRAPQADLLAFSERMGWQIPWYTDTQEFQEAYDTTEWFAFDVFLRDADRAFQTYRTRGRGGRADRHCLEPPRPHAAGAPGGMGGHAARQAADATLRLVGLPRRVRRGRGLAAGPR